MNNCTFILPKIKLLNNNLKIYTKWTHNIHVADQDSLEFLGYSII